MLCRFPDVALRLIRLNHFLEGTMTHASSLFRGIVQPLHVARAGVSRLADRRRRVSWLFCAALLGAGLLADPASANGDDVTGSLEMSGSSTGAATGAGAADHASNYDGDYKVTVEYTVATKIGPDGKKVFDLEKSRVKLTDDKYKWTTLDIPITEVTGDPETGKVKSIKYKGDKWYPDAEGDGIVDKGVEGSVEVDPEDPKKGEGSVRAAYDSGDGKRKYAYTFTSTPPEPAEPKEQKAAESKVESGKTLKFDAAAGLLTITDDTIVGAPDPGDPIIGADLDFPEFAFVGTSLDEATAVFWALGSDSFSISGAGGVFQTSDLPYLFYDLTENLFFGALFNTKIAGVPSTSIHYDPLLMAESSPFLTLVDNWLDPGSQAFEPDLYYYFTLAPDVPFYDLTAGFTVSGETGATDLHFVAAGKPIPLPASLALLATGIVSLLGCARVRGARRADSAA